MRRTDSRGRLQTGILSRHCGNFRVTNRFRLSALAGLLILSVMPRGNAMEIKVMDDQLILSGPVVASDFDAVESGLTAQPQIKDFCIGRTSDNLCSTLDPGMAA